MVKFRENKTILELTEGWTDSKTDCREAERRDKQQLTFNIEKTLSWAAHTKHNWTKLMTGKNIWWTFQIECLAKKPSSCKTVFERKVLWCAYNDETGIFSLVNISVQLLLQPNIKYKLFCLTLTGFEKIILSCPVFNLLHSNSYLIKHLA